MLIFLQLFCKLHLWQLYFWGYIFPPCDSPNCGHLNVEVIKFNLKISSTCWERYVFKCIYASTGKPLKFINYWLMIYSMLLLISRVLWSNIHVRLLFDQTSLDYFYLIKCPFDQMAFDQDCHWSDCHWSSVSWSCVHLIKCLFDQCPLIKCPWIKCCSTAPPPKFLK